VLDQKGKDAGHPHPDAGVPEGDRAFPNVDQLLVKTLTPEVVKTPAKPQGRGGNAATCASCGVALHPKRRCRPQEYCGPACRQAAYRARKRAGGCTTAGVTINQAPLELLGHGHHWPDAHRPGIGTVIHIIVAREVGGGVR
jgi:hypothetical protein